MSNATLARSGSCRVRRNGGPARSSAGPGRGRLAQMSHGTQQSPRFEPMSDSRPRNPLEGSDERLMLLTAKGDLDAFGRLVDRHHQRALNLAYRLSGDAERSKDIVQESFLRILKAARKYEPRALFTTYLYSVIRNMVREKARQTRRRRENSLDDRLGNGLVAEIDSNAVAHPVSPDVVLQRTELEEGLMAALASLPDDLRVVFVLSEMEGLSYAEIASVCECPTGTVASRKHAAITRLRVILQPLRSK